MTNPVERERKKYRWQQLQRRSALLHRIEFWLTLAFWLVMVVVVAIFGHS